MCTQNTLPSAPAEESRPTRRTFQLAVIYVFSGIISLTMAVSALAYLLVPPLRRRASGWIDAGDVSQLPSGVPTELSFQESRLDGWRLVTEKKTAWVVQQPNKEVVAFGPQCTHLGCAYHFEAGANQFVCPCHTSVFSLDGKVISGPAPRALDRYLTKIENNRLQIGALKQSAS